MYYEVQEVEMNGEKIPYRIDNYILGFIQGNYESIPDFEKELMGWGENEEGKLYQKKEPSVLVINKVFPEMVREGFACRNKECNLEDAEIVRMIDKNPATMAGIIHEELVRCMTGKKKAITPKKKAPRK